MVINYSHFLAIEVGSEKIDDKVYKEKNYDYKIYDELPSLLSVVGKG